MSRASVIGLLATACAAPGVPDVQLAPQTSHTDASLRGLCVVDAQTAWASGSGGTFLRTIDGGRTWRVGRVPGCEQRDFRDVEAFDAEVALLLAVGEPAELWRTEDGGASWSRVHHDPAPGMFLDSLDFWPDGRGLCFGDPVQGSFTMLESDDWGRAWSRIEAQRLPPPLPDEAGFAASGSLISCRGKTRAIVGTGGGAARVLITEDGGRTWEAARSPMRQGEPSSGIFSLTLMAGDQAVAVGGDYGDSEANTRSACYSTDGGRTWRCAEEPLPPYRSSVAAAPLGQPAWLIAMGKGGASLSLDGGRSWRQLDLPGHYALEFAPQLWNGVAVGYAVGAQGRVSRVELRRLE